MVKQIVKPQLNRKAGQIHLIPFKTQTKSANGNLTFLKKIGPNCGNVGGPIFGYSSVPKNPGDGGKKKGLGELEAL